MQPQGKIQLNFQGTRFKMGKKGRTHSDNQEIHWKLQEIKIKSNLLFYNKTCFMVKLKFFVFNVF